MHEAQVLESDMPDQSARVSPSLTVSTWIVYVAELPAPSKYANWTIISIMAWDQKER